MFVLPLFLLFIFVLIVNPKNKETVSAPTLRVVGEVSNLAGVEGPINSKVYHIFVISYRLSVKRF